MSIFIFRIFILFIFLFSAWLWGNWKNRAAYYPTVLFIMVVNLSVAFLTYHHELWRFNPDILVKTHTTVELLNAFIVLPSVTFLYLSKFPDNNKLHQLSYLLLWVGIFVGVEFIAHYIVGSLSYYNGWSLKVSAVFDIAMFSLIRLHSLRPIIAWIATLVLAVIILLIFDFISAEFK